MSILDCPYFYAEAAAFAHVEATLWPQGSVCHHCGSMEKHYYSIFKRGMKALYQHCAEHHLQRYFAEFDFRYSNRVALGIDDTGRSSTKRRSTARSKSLLASL